MGTNPLGAHRIALGDATPPSDGNQPPIATLPSGNAASVLIVGAPLLTRTSQLGPPDQRTSCREPRIGKPMSPPTMTSPFGNTASARTMPQSKGEPKGCHALPSHRASRLIGVPPNWPTQPPTSRSPLGSSANVCTAPSAPPAYCDHAPLR